MLDTKLDDLDKNMKVSLTRIDACAVGFRYNREVSVGPSHFESSWMRRARLAAAAEAS